MGTLVAPSSRFTFGKLVPPLPPPPVADNVVPSKLKLAPIVTVAKLVLLSNLNNDGKIVKKDYMFIFLDSI